MSYAEDEGHDIPYDMLDFISSEDTDWDSVWERGNPLDYWETRDGDIIAIRNMSTKHIERCIALIKNSIEANLMGVRNYIWRIEYLEPLQNELVKRRKI